MKKKLEKVILIILIIQTMILGNFIFIGKNIVEAISEETVSSTTTNCKNVELSAYFKTEEEKYTIQKDLYLGQTEKLYIKVEVKKEGYFEGSLSLENSNVDLKNTILSDKVEKIEGNKIKLQQIRAGETVEIPVEIVLQRKTQVPLSFFNAQVQIKIEGIYQGNLQDNIEVAGSVDVNVKWSSKNKSAVLEGDVITNKTYYLDEIEKSVLQMSLYTGLTEQDYAIKSTDIKIQVPCKEKVEKIEVIGIDTNLPITESNYRFDKETGIVEVNLFNGESEGNVLWQNKLDQILLYIQYQEKVEIRSAILDVNAQLELYDTTKLEKSLQFSLEEEKEGLSTYKIQNTETQMYNGRLLAGEKKDFQRNSIINLNDTQILHSFEFIEEQDTYRIGEKEENANSRYLQTKITKQELDFILGEKGILRILNQNQEMIAEITKQSIAENGEVIITYPENIKEIIIQIENPEQRGKLELRHIKELQEDKGNVAAQQADALIQRVQNYDKYVEEKVLEIGQAKETISTQINKKELTALELNENIEMRVILLTNSDEQKLFKNPKIEIQFPAEIEEINVKSIHLLYEEEMKIVSAGMLNTENGKILQIQLEGEQSYHREELQNANISIAADIKISTEIGNVERQIITKLTNSNQEEVQDILPIQICTLENVLPLNSMKELGLESNGVQEEQQVTLESETAIKQTSVDIAVINHKNDEVKDVSILGRFPTQGIVEQGEKENTMPIQVISSLQLQGVNDCQVKIYYSTQESVTQDITDEKNQWSEQIEDGNEVKNYLIKIDKMQTNQKIAASYQIALPEDLESQMVSYQQYKVLYHEGDDQKTETVNSTSLLLTTEEQEKVSVQANLSATVGEEELKEGDTVKTGEVIHYRLEVKNTSQTELQNLNAQMILPEDAVWVEPDEGEIGYEYTGAKYYLERQEREISYLIDKMSSGEVLVKEFDVRIRQDIQSNSIKSVAQIQWEDNTIMSNEWQNKLEKTDLRVSLKRVLDRGVNIAEGSTINYYVIIENMTNQKKENVMVRPVIPEGTEIESLIVKQYENNEPVEEKWLEELEGDVSIGDIKENGVVVLEIILKINKMDASNNQIGLVALAKTQDQDWCRSNIYITEVQSFEVSMNMVSNSPSEIIKKDDVFEYTIEIQNNSSSETTMILLDQVPEILDILYIKKNGETIQERIENEEEIQPIPNDIEEEITLAPKEKMVYIIGVRVRDKGEEEISSVINKATLLVNGAERATAQVEHQYDKEDDSGNKIYSIRGTVWEDIDKNGRRTSEEPLIEGIRVLLLDANTGEIVKDEDGNERITITNDQGLYEFYGVQRGKYMPVFEYDTTQYELSPYRAEDVAEAENSDVIAKELEIQGQKRLYAITEIIDVENNDINDIDMGLIKLEIFNLSLDKNIQKVIVQYDKGTETYQYQNTNFAKIELDSKQMKGANLVVEYQIKVKNVGEVAGYAKNIVDELPKGLNFSSTLNPDWYLVNGRLYYEGFANQKINPGEEKVVSLVLTQTMTEESTGTIVNTAELLEAYNETGLGETEEQQDNKGQADLVIGIKTGSVYLYIGLSVFIAFIFITGVYFIIKKVLI